MNKLMSKHVNTRIQMQQVVLLNEITCLFKRVFFNLRTSYKWKPQNFYLILKPLYKRRPSKCIKVRGMHVWQCCNKVLNNGLFCVGMDSNGSGWSPVRGSSVHNHVGIHLGFWKGVSWVVGQILISKEGLFVSRR